MESLCPLCGDGQWYVPLHTKVAFSLKTEESFDLLQDLLVACGGTNQMAVLPPAELRVRGDSRPDRSYLAQMWCDYPWYWAWLAMHLPYLADRDDAVAALPPFTELSLEELALVMDVVSERGSNSTAHAYMMRSGGWRAVLKRIAEEEHERGVADDRWRRGEDDEEDEEASGKSGIPQSICGNHDGHYYPWPADQLLFMSLLTEPEALTCLENGADLAPWFCLWASRGTLSRAADADISRLAGIVARRTEMFVPEGKHIAWHSVFARGVTDEEYLAVALALADAGVAVDDLVLRFVRACFGAVVCRSGLCRGAS